MSKPILAVVGRPNVGKSTFFNRIIGERKAIVEDVPGVTRDRIYADAEWTGHEFTLIDTGGIEPSSKDAILAQMRDQANMAIDMAAVDRIPGDDLVRDLISRPDLKVAIKDDSDEKIKLVFLQAADDPQLPALRGGKIGALPAALYLIAQAIAPGGIQPTGGVFLQAKAQLLRNQPFRKIPYGAIVGADDPALVQGDKHRSVLVHQGQDLLHFGILHGYRLLSPLPYHFGARP